VLVGAAQHAGGDGSGVHAHAEAHRRAPLFFARAVELV